MSFGKKLYKLRSSCGLSQEQLAQQCNITRQSVSKWELDQGYPEAENLLTLCRVLNVDLDYLLRDEITSQRVSSQQAVCNPYQKYLGKWVTLLLDDIDFGAINLAAIIALNESYVVYEMKGKGGVLKISDIKSISEADLSEKKAATLGSIEVFDLENEENPFNLFRGKECAIKLRRDFAPGLFSGSTSIAWLPSAEVIEVSDEYLTVLFRNKEMLIKIEEVLTVIEK